MAYGVPVLCLGIIFKSCCMRNVVVILFCLLITGAVIVQDDMQVPYTLADRDRLIRVEARLDAMVARFDAIDARFQSVDTKFESVDAKFKAVDDRFEAIEKRLDSIDTRLGNLTMGIFGLIGVFIVTLIWDRHTAMRPVLKALDVEG